MMLSSAMGNFGRHRAMLWTPDTLPASVTVLAMYPKQPFDFAGRTGTVSFDFRTTRRARTRHGPNSG